MEREREKGKREKYERDEKRERDGPLTRERVFASAID